MTYREPLPDGCPPDEAEAISGPRTVYRLSRSNPPTDDDFMSQRAEKPHNIFNTSECIARGLSVFTDRSSLEGLLKRPNRQDMIVCQVMLDNGAGRIQKTGRSRFHYTWWPLAGFNILENCLVV